MIGHSLDNCYARTTVCRHCHKTGHFLAACPEIVCHYCKQKGHIAPRCPNKRTQSGQKSRPGSAASNHQSSDRNRSNANSAQGNQGSLPMPIPVQSHPNAWIPTCRSGKLGRLSVNPDKFYWLLLPLNVLIIIFPYLNFMDRLFLTVERPVVYWMLGYFLLLGWIRIHE